MNRFKLFFPLAFLLALAFTSCTKSEKGDCDLQNKYIYEPIVFDESCNCIVSGKVKYIKDCSTAALVDYGNGDCDNIAVKTICINGKCEESAGAYTEEFEFDCLQTIIDGPISDEEASDIGI